MKKKEIDKSILPDKAFETTRDNLANYIKGLKTKEELNDFLAQLSAKYLKERVPKMMPSLMDNMDLFFGKK